MGVGATISPIPSRAQARVPGKASCDPLVRQAHSRRTFPSSRTFTLIQPMVSERCSLLRRERTPSKLTADLAALMIYFVYISKFQISGPQSHLLYRVGRFR